MSRPNFSVLLFSLMLSGGLLGGSLLTGCSTSPKKKAIDTGAKFSEQTYYDKANTALAKNQYLEASKNLEALDTYFPTGQYTQQTQLDLLYTRFQQHNYPAAVALAERFIRLNPNSPQLDYVYYVRAVSNMEQNYDGLLRYTSLKQSHRDVGYIKIAYQNFAELIRRFPNSIYSVDAAKRMQFINQELAEHEMNAARFNLKRQAWVAALQRARWVFEYYPQTPQIPEAIATLAYCYQQVGDEVTAKQYIELLKANYPKLVRPDGTVNLTAARQENSRLNKLTLGILGRAEKIASSLTAPKVTAAHE